jgi:glutamate transport system substrate-binding protein
MTEGTSMTRRPAHRILAFAGAAALAVSLAACSSDDSDSAAAGDEAESTEDTGGEAAGADFPEGSTMAALSAAGEVTIGTKFDQAGFGLLNPATNEPEGFDVEVAKIIAEELGIADDGITWTETVSANREPFLEEGRVDYVVATYTINDDRKEIIDFAGPYYQAGQDIMVASGNPLGITGPDDLAGTTTCSVEGSTPAENIRTNYPDADITLFDVYSKCSEALKNGQVDSVTTDNVILLGIIAQDPESFELVDNPFTEEPYGIGVAKGDDEFRSFINDVLEAAYEDGRWAEAWDSTAGAFAETPEPPAVDRY